VSGRSTQINGVEADIVVPTLFSPYNIGERYLEYPLPNDRVNAAYSDPLVDVDAQAKLWFQRNYIPFIQKKESKWTQMLATLKTNSTYRLKNDPNFSLFLESLKSPPPTLDISRNWGDEDLQMAEAVNIVKDMVFLEAMKS
jgi:carboxyl-terminal processing protease